jgi:hypothetical protein
MDFHLDVLVGLMMAVSFSMHVAIIPHVGPFLAGIGPDFTAFIETAVGFVAGVHALLQCIIAGTGSAARAEDEQGGQRRGFHDHVMRCLWFRIGFIPVSDRSRDFC